MNTYKEQSLIEAFDIYVQQQNALLPTDEELWGMTFSPEFEAKMAQMFRRRRYGYGYYVLFGTALRRVASIIVALLVSAAIVTASVEALRTPVVQFFTEVYEKFTQIFVAADTANLPSAVELEPHTPAYIPAGYELNKVENYSDMYRLTYEEACTGSTIRVMQRWKDENSLMVDTESVPHTEITVGSYKGLFYIDHEKTVLVFTDEENVYTLTGSTDVEALLKIAESIVK